MSKELFQSITIGSQDHYMELVEAIVFCRKVVFKDNSDTDTFTPLMENSFIDQVRQFENLTLKDVGELVDLANSAPEEELFGLKLYAKLMDLEKDGVIYGDYICDRLYRYCTWQSGEVVL